MLVDKLVYECGFSCGQMFGKRALDKLTKINSNIELREMVNDWFDFDAEAGFGMLKQTEDIAFQKNDKSSDVISGRIEYTDNFQRRDKIDYPNEVCNFIRGYCKGVLRIFVNRKHYDYKFDLKCNKEEFCDRHGGSGLKCVFDVIATEGEK